VIEIIVLGIIFVGAVSAAVWGIVKWVRGSGDHAVPGCSGCPLAARCGTSNGKHACSVDDRNGGCNET